MNEELTAKLIRDARKQKEMTQKDLASRIGVSVQAVSKWENAKGFPDVSLLEPLSRELGLSIVELVTGVREDAEKQTENVLKDVIDVSVRQTKEKTVVLKAALAILALGMILIVMLWSAPKRFIILQTIFGYKDAIGFKGFTLIGDLWIFALVGVLSGVLFSLKRKKGMIAAAGIAAGIYLLCDLLLLKLCWNLPYGYDWVGFTVVIVGCLTFGAAISCLLMDGLFRFRKNRREIKQSQII